MYLASKELYSPNFVPTFAFQSRVYFHHIDLKSYLQQSNRNIAFNPRDDPDICLQIQLDMHLETTLDILVIEAEALVSVLGLIAVFAVSSSHTRSF